MRVAIPSIFQGISTRTSEERKNCGGSSVAIPSIFQGISTGVTAGLRW
ncbi:hypothetical protein SAMN06265339_0288 [Desulfurobacterium pacificum]|uniref:Uncharacterized protein n=1 Tax=Desulfurobacterium pacificum TaxID=240166 RepID=A0ABY1NAY2_9BACT|nr:hypothetical protein SAMN06265339_0288 [Desulfurobacterium pacificum]